jgi:hypothetical protein
MRIGNNERGSALALVPAAILVSLLLIGVAVDSAATLNAQRRTTEIADLAALDIANTALDQAFLADKSTADRLAIRLDPVRAQRAADQIEQQATGRDGLLDIQITVTVETATSAVVTVSARRKRLIRLAGGSDWVQVRARARSELQIVD